MPTTTPGGTVDRWEISAFQLVTGIIVGMITLAIAFGARYAVGYLNGAVRSAGNGLTVSSSLLDFVGSYFFLALIVVLVVAKIAHNTVKKPLTVRGPLKVVVGALTGVFYYLVLAGGTISVLIGFSPSSATGTVAFSLTLLITLVLLELSCGMRIMQGLLEYREGKMLRRVTQPTTSAPPMPGPAPQMDTRPSQGVPPPTGTSFCPRCGSPVGQASFCENCGAKLK